MKRAIIGLACALWLVHTGCVDAASTLPLLRKPAPAQTANIPWDELSERAVAIAQPLVEKPTAFARGPAETFACSPEQYFWMLDNPDRVVTAWRRLGAKCVPITRRAPGRFGYADDQGSDVSWETIHQSPGVRIWYAEGKVKPGVGLPLVSVKALVVLRHKEGKTAEGTTFVQHQAEMVIHTDSKAAVAVTKMMGQSATKLAEQGLGQLQMFFAALSSYIDRHPDQADTLFRVENAPIIQQTQKLNR